MWSSSSQEEGGRDAGSPSRGCTSTRGLPMMTNSLCCPRCRVFSYRDHLGNNVHHFDIPGQHKELVIIGRTLVEVQPLDGVPASLPPSSWEELDHIVQSGDYWEMLLPSEFAKPTESL